jgi:hypothetical protein
VADYVKVHENWGYADSCCASGPAAGQPDTPIRSVDLEHIEDGIFNAQAAADAAIATADEALGSTGYDVVLLAGQSNMIGRDPAGPDSSLDRAVAELFMLNAVNAVVPAVEPLVYQVPAGTDSGPGIGPGGPFGRSYIREGSNERRKVLLVGSAVGGSKIVNATGTTWNAGVADPNLASFAIARANAAIAAEPGSRLVAILWAQGDTDGIANETQAAFEAATDALFARFRSQITGASNATPIITFGSVPEHTAGTMSQIKAAQAGTPSRVVNSYYVAPPPGVNHIGDTLHFNNAAQRYLGQQAHGYFVQSKLGQLGFSALAESLRVEKLNNSGPITHTDTGAGGLLLQRGVSTADVALRTRNTASTQDRFAINVAGTMAWGSGTAVADTVLFRAAANVLSQDTSDVFKTGQNVTASRPSAVTVGKGAQFYDSTLNKPIWSDGAVWRDAVGTAI